MTREDVIRMAGEAGFGANQRNTLLVKIERFADLVVKEMINDGWRQCAKGQRTTQFCGMAEKAREEEREECAKIVDEWYHSLASEPEMLEIAQEIRARKSK